MPAENETNGERSEENAEHADKPSENEKQPETARLVPDDTGDISHVFANETAILRGARRLRDPEERTRYVREMCGGDSALAEDILRRADLSPAAENACPPPASTELGTDEGSPSEGPGSVIDHYKILQEIGKGGFGIVYMAEQLEPVRRRVALKIIKLGMDTREVTARFEAERQALAMMNHPNICQVFDGGATATGRPYFVMELVKGTPLLDYCDSKNLSTRQRLELFVDVCNAIQHAHQKGIIHRDIKPSNIMVTVHGDKPVPKVIDFGIAKALHEELTDRTLFTRFEQFVGTPAYMSPEQAQSSALGIDTRSDVYSLGVLLYELLTGRPPFDPKELCRAAIDEIRRRIREDEPPRPSTQLKSMTAEELTDVAKHRNEEPKRLRKMVHGELDWIVMKALEKEPARRYETAAKLSDEVTHYLRNEPVTVGAPSQCYRFKKFVWKHRAPLAAGTAIIVLLVTGVVASVFFAIKEWKARQELSVTQRETQIRRTEALLREGDALQRDGNLAGALLPYLRAFQSDPDKKSRNELHRLRIGSLFGVCPGIVGMWFLDDSVNHVSFAPDGERILAASDGGKIDLLTQYHAKPLLSPRNEDEEENDVKSSYFHPREETILSAFEKGEARLLRVEDGQLIRSIPHDMEVSQARFVGDGSRIVTACHDGVARIWNSDGTLMRAFTHASPWRDYQFQILRAPAPEAVPRKGRKLLVIIENDGALAFRLFDADGRILLPNYPIRLWRVPEGTPLPERADQGVTVAESEDRLHLLIFGANRERLLMLAEDDFADNAEALAILKRSIGAISRDEEESSVQTKDREALIDAVARLSGFLPPPVVEQDELEPLRTLLGGRPEADAVQWQVALALGVRSGIFAAQLSPNEDLLVTACRDANAACIWNVADGTLRHELKHGSWVYAAAFDPAGEHVVTASFDRHVCIWEAETGRLLHRLIHPFGVLEAAFSPDGRYVMSASMDYGVRVWSADSGKPVMPVMWHESYLRDASFCPDGRRIVTATVNGVVRVWDLALASRKPDLIASDESDVAFAGEGAAPRVEDDRGWNVEAAGKRLKRWREGGDDLAADVTTYDFEEEITKLLLNPVIDNQLAVIAGDRAWLVTFEPDLKMPLPHPNAREDDGFVISHAEFSSAGDLLVTTVRDPDLHPLYAQVWSTENGEAFGPKLWHNDGVHQATFSSAGNLLMTSSEDKTAVIWRRTPQGFERRHLLQHGHEVYGADFSTNDQLIVTYSRDGVARVWESRTAFPVTPWIDQWWGYGVITKPRFDGNRRIILRREGGRQATFQLEPTLMGMNDLLQHAQLLTGRRYSDDVMSPLEAVPLSKDALRDLWMSAPKALGTSEDSRNWHAREARYAEEYGQRDAAIFHLERVMKDTPPEGKPEIEARINALRQGE